MSDPVIIALITAIPASLSGMVAAYFSYKAATVAKATMAVAKHTEENTNHLKDELVALTKKSSHAEGLLQGKLERSKD